MKGRATRIVLSLPFIIVAGVFGLYLACGFFLVNPLAQKLLPWVGETKLASRLSAERVSFNPLTLEVTVDGARLTGPKGQFLAGFDRLYLNMGTTGLFRRAWRIQDIQLRRPRATFAVQDDGTFNWAVLLAKLNEGKKTPSGTMTRVLIDHLKITDGAIEYTDANRPGRPFKAVVQPLAIECGTLSTLPGDHGNYGIVAGLPEQGGTLTLKGGIALNPLSSQGEIVLGGLRLADAQQAIQNPLNFELSSGTLGADLRYRLAMVPDGTGAGAPSLQVNDANLRVRDFALSPRGGAPVLELSEARIAKATIDLAERRVEVTNISLMGGRLAATRNVQGALDWQGLFAAGKERPAAAPSPSEQSPPKTNAAAPSAPWKIAVHEIHLADWSARFTDQGFARPLTVSAGGFELTAALAGETGAKPAIAVGPVHATLGPVRVLSGTREAATLRRAALVNAKLNLADNRLLIDAVELNGLRTSVMLDKNKALNWAGILEAAPGAVAAAKPAPVTPAPGGKTGMEVQLARFRLDGLEVGIVDQSMDTPVALDVARGFVTMKNLSLDLNRAVPMEAGFSLRQGGNFQAAGAIIPGKASGTLGLKLAGLSLKPFTPYVNRFARLHLRSGAASTAGKLMVVRTDAGTRLDFKGGFAVDGLALIEEDTGDPFFGWERLSSGSLELKLNPGSLHMNELVALHPFGKVIIFEDKSINLKRMLRSADSGSVGTAEVNGPARTDAVTGKTGEPEEKKSETAAAAFPLAIERLRMDGADVAFADLSLKPQFGTRMHDLAGVVTGLSNDPATTALVELDGKVDEFGSARVRGSIQPFRATDFTDLKLSFRNLEMTSLTPYSGKFAGRKIDAGKLSVDLEYKVRQRRLLGENKVVINKLKLGERVESPEAINLPLDLAIAILEDKDGVIDMDLPVSGNLDDPQFSYGGIIWKAVVNVLTKVVTAPFRALGRLLGISNADKLGEVEFDFGAATLLPPEQEKLKEMGEALAKRPALALSVSPVYDLQNDARAIRQLRVRQDVAQRMGLKVVPGQDPGPVDTANPRTRKALETLYDERFGKEGGAKAIAAEYEKAKDSSKTIYAVMLERLTLQIPVTEAELTRLAQARGEAMRQTLITLGNADPLKVNVSEPANNGNGGTVVVCKVTLGVADKPASASSPSPAAP